MTVRIFFAMIAASFAWNLPAKAEDDIFVATKALGRGINLGNMLDAPSEGEWGLSLKEEFFPAIKKAGFDSVRLPVRWSAHTEDQAPFSIDPEFLARVDWALDQAAKAKLNVVLNVHHFNEMDANPAANEAKLRAIWKQLASHYTDLPKTVYFELLNEPHDKLTEDLWNASLAPLLKIVRETNPSRPVIVGPGMWNGFRSLAKLKLPEDDKNLIVTFHYYEPFHFTHQGAEWSDGSAKWLGTKWTGSKQELATLRGDFETVSAWSRAHNRPIYLGEFGSYSKADIDSRVCWTKAVADEAIGRGFAFAYWEFGSGFGAYDPATSTWRKPLLDALVPKTP